MENNGKEFDITSEYAKKYRFHLLNFNEYIIDEIFSDTLPDMITVLPSERLTQYLVALAQYMAYVTYQHNLDTIYFMEHKRVFDSKRMEIITLHDLKGRSNDELLAKALDKDASLKPLEDKSKQAEKISLIAEKITDSIKELINAIKKELERRSYERQTGKV
jgi:hypothetical protein